MALINCPECGKEISDLCKACPNCGYPIQNELDEIVPPQPVEVTGIKLHKMSKKKKLIAFLALGLIIVLGLSFVGISMINKQKQENAAKAAAAKVIEDYHNNLLLLELDMYTGGRESETLCNLIAQVWYNTIYEKNDSITDKYTKINDTSFFNSDFNVSLRNLFADQSTIQTIDEIKKNQDSVSALMKKMQNPPKEYEKAYETLGKLYSAYQGLTDLAINPSGNLTEFSANKNTKADDFVTFYKTLDTQVPDKAESSVSSLVSSK